MQPCLDSVMSPKTVEKMLMLKAASATSAVAQSRTALFLFPHDKAEQAKQQKQKQGGKTPERQL